MQAFKALASNDSCFTLLSTHPMHSYVDYVRTQIQQQRLKREQQVQFLQALLLHIELAVFVCDESGKIIEANPAVAKLLGITPQHLNQLQDLGTLIFSAEKSCRSITNWKNGELKDTLSIRVSIAEIQGNTYKIITLSSIHNELINKEQQAYKKLTEVLTHEVANSVTPLSSIAQSSQTLLQGQKSLNSEQIQDLSLALNTIVSCTQVLAEFVQSFRQVSRLPKPNLAVSQLSPIVQKVVNLHQVQLAECNIKLEFNAKTQQLVMLDKIQIEQVLINLLKNAIEAVCTHNNQTGQKFITLFIGQNEQQQLYLEIADNGEGVAEHVVDNIFVPFFTTKRQGSGIGLSLSKQIMINHAGDLQYIPREKGACFRCIFG
ncbi:sensor histidine kinase [Catenovulum sp. SX2]|uniref:sensor histidine kinase n=1 Tax=Catenovulum sp. SX2 TaxID=3398614 RepID=UPI003F8625D4